MRDERGVRGLVVKAEQAAEALGKTALFSNLKPDALRALGDRSGERRYKKGQLLFHEGDSGDSVFVVVDGSVKVFRTSEDGNEMVLTTLRPFDSLGEITLCDGGPRSASAEALEPSVALIVSRPALMELLASSPQVGDAIMRNLGGLVRRLTEQATDLVFLDLHGRVAKLLVGLASDRGKEVEDGAVLDLQLTQTDLASMVGGSRQSVNQILRAFERRGYLDMEGKTIVIKEAERLKRRAGL